MQPENAQDTCKLVLENIYSKDRKYATSLIDKYYGINSLIADPQCRFENPFLILHSKSEIVSGFNSFTDQFTDTKVEVESIIYSKEKQAVAARLKLEMWPKALGGLIKITQTQVLRIQLEKSDQNPELLLILEHHEVQKVEELLSQMPVIGSLYQDPLRTTVGKIALTSGSVMSMTGVMDIVPATVDTASQAARFTKSTLLYCTNEALNATKSVCDSIGLLSIVKSAESTATSILSDTISHVRQRTDLLKSTSASWLEHSQNLKIDCYSPTCTPGRRCYSPTCFRNQPNGGLNLSQLMSTFYKSSRPL